MNIGIIGEGAIGRYARDRLLEKGHVLRAMLLRPGRLEGRAANSGGTAFVSSSAELPDDIDHMIDCAGHAALAEHGPGILARGINLTTVSIGALADPDLANWLEQAAASGNSRLYLASGAVGALDCLRAARAGELRSVTYTGRKPPRGWKGSAAESRLDLDKLAVAQSHFDGPARAAAIEYPKNANVAAAIALAGLGFDDTRVRLIADPTITENIHTLEAVGDFGTFSFEIKGISLPDNPRSSALAAMSVISSIEQAEAAVCFR